MMRTLGVSAALIGCLAVATSAEAAARVFVSVSGDDANDCSMVATPCRTLNAAITQVDASGEVIVLTTGSYAGATISKAVRINVPSGVVAFSASPITITAGLTDSVAIRGVTLKALTPGSGIGINFQSGKNLSIENCLLDGWQNGIVVQNSGSPVVYVIDTIVRNGSGNGIQSSVSLGAAIVAVHNSRFENHGGGCGVIAVSNSTISARETVTAGAGFGFCTTAASAQLNCQDCMATGHSSDGFAAFNGSTMRVAQSMSTKNVNGFSNDGLSTFESLGNNLVAGNGTDTSGTITVIAGK
jgi:hypothetical protein